MQYQLKAPATAISPRDDHSTITVPAGEVITVVGYATDGRLLVVNIRGNELLMFESQLKQQGRQILLVSA